eukprot:Skav215196  [mRNA]  locus=scaffold3330:134406:134729:- [translate_table: standard]
MNALGGGNARGSFPKLLLHCQSLHFNLVISNQPGFLQCLKQETQISEDCGKCFVRLAALQATSCGGQCTEPWGKWCRKDCLECLSYETTLVNQCAGVAVPAAETCEE